MNYIFNAEGKCVASCNYEPTTEDLESRNEAVIASETDYELSKIKLVGGVIKLIEVTDAETFATLKSSKLSDIKAKLSATDYKRMKYDDGDLSAEEYEPVKVERHNLRVAYNNIENATTIEELNNI